MQAKNNKIYLRTIFRKDDADRAHYLRENGFTRDIRWIKAAAKSGKIVISGAWRVEWYDFYCKQMTAIVNTLNVAHGSNWDMEIYPWYDANGALKYYLKPIILYPYLNLTNSRDQQEDIHDFLVTFDISYSGEFANLQLTYNNIYATRLTYQYSHLNSMYVHSHLTSQSQMNPVSSLSYQSYCTGGDTEIDDIMSEAVANGFSEGMFGLFITMLDTLVAWESLEGVPYNNMSDIVVDSAEHRADLTSQTRLHRYKTLLSDFLDNYPYEFVILDGTYKIKQTSDFKKSLRDVIIRDFGTDPMMANLIVKKAGDHYMGYTQEMTINNIDDLRERMSYIVQGERELPYIFINKQKKELTVLPFEPEQEINIDDFYIHPKFIDYVTKEMETTLYEKCIRYSALESINN